MKSLSKEAFKVEVTSWARRLGVEVRELHVRPMTRKWGSCSTAGRVTFDTGLLAEPPDVRDEVIVHELLHLKVPNHGKLFRQLLRSYLGRPPVLGRSSSGSSRFNAPKSRERPSSV